MTSDEFVEDVRRLLAIYDSSNQGPTVIPSGGDIQAALNRGDTLIQLERGGDYESIVVERPVRIVGNGARLIGQGKPALYVRPGSSDVVVENLAYASSFQSCIQLGDNGPTQNTLALVPRNIRLVASLIVSHFGPNAKNAIENNATGVELIDMAIGQVYNTGAVESHVLATINTPGGLTCRGGTLSGGSITCFTGGDTVKVPDADIEGVFYENLTITKPSQWQGDGVNRNIKNLVEFKNVTHAVVRACDISNSWGPIQRGFAVMLTPKVDGRVVGVLFENNTIFNVGAGFNITGRNPTGADPTRTDDIRIINNNLTIDKLAYAGVGWPFLLQDGMGHLTIEGNMIRHNGNALVYVDDTEKIASLVMRGNTANVGAYGIRTPYGNNGEGWQQVFDELIVEDNIFSGASTVFKRNFPKNSYV
jgi:hypothetical protein